jgi:hypothetical protein
MPTKKLSMLSWIRSSREHLAEAILWGSVGSSRRSGGMPLDEVAGLGHSSMG